MGEVPSLLVILAGAGSSTWAGTSTTIAASDASESSALSDSSDGDTSTGADSTSTGDGPDPVALVAWYPFDDDVRLGVVVDAMGLHPGACTPAECPEPIVGRIGGAARFDGVDDPVRVAHDDGLELGGTWTAAGRGCCRASGSATTSRTSWASR